LGRAGAGDGGEDHETSEAERLHRISVLGRGCRDYGERRASGDNNAHRRALHSSMRNLDVIRNGLAEVWETAGRKFVTFEIDGRGGPDAGRWIQYLDGELNVRWPLDESPATELARRGVALPAGAFVGFWTAQESAIVEVGDVLLDDVARLVEALFAKVVAGETRFTVVSEERRVG